MNWDSIVWLERQGVRGRRGARPGQDATSIRARLRFSLEAMQDVVGTSPTLTEIDTLRKVAQGAANSIDSNVSSCGIAPV